MLYFPLMVYFAGLALLAAWFIQSRTTIGRNFYAVGGGEELTHASGLNVNRVRILGFMIAGAFYALGVLIVNVIANGMIVTGLPRYVQDGVLGLLVITAVYLSTDWKSLAFVK